MPGGSADIARIAARTVKFIHYSASDLLFNSGLSEGKTVFNFRIVITTAHGAFNLCNALVNSFVHFPRYCTKIMCLPAVSVALPGESPLVLLRGFCVLRIFSRDSLIMGS